jgi:hypothetical protein
MGMQRFGEVLNQSGKEALARFLRSPFEDASKRCAFIKSLEGRR